MNRGGISINKINLLHSLWEWTVHIFLQNEIFALLPGQHHHMKTLHCKFFFIRALKPVLSFPLSTRQKTLSACKACPELDYYAEGIPFFLMFWLAIVHRKKQQQIIINVNILCETASWMHHEYLLIFAHIINKTIDFYCAVIPRLYIFVVFSLGAIMPDNEDAVSGKTTNN